MANPRGRRYFLLLYPEEDLTHKRALEIISEFYQYSSITHDRDVNFETGEVKKSHTHVVLEFKNPRYLQALAKDLGIQENYLQLCKNFDSCLSYLIHFDEMEKFQYDIDDVKGPLKIKLKKLLRKIGKDECDRMIDIFDIIDSHKGYLSTSSLNREMAKLGLWDVYRRSGSFILRHLDEHNYLCQGNDKMGNVMHKIGYQVDIDQFLLENGS